MDDKLTESFMDLYMRNVVTADDIDDFVAIWHNSPEDDVPLHEFLGLTWDEYGQWVQQHDSLIVIRGKRWIRSPEGIAALTEASEQVQKAFNDLTKSRTWLLYELSCLQW